MLKRYFLFSIWAFGTTFPVFAEEPVNCNVRFSNTLELGACFNEQLNGYDTELNTTYQSIIKKLKARDAPWGSLKKAQREWITFRDQNCMFHSDLNFGGSASGSAFVECKARMTEERLDELSAVLEQLERQYIN